MTTEGAPPPVRLTVLEWRLYLVTTLALIYALVWRAIDRPMGAASEAPREVAEVPTSPARGAAWLDELPAAQRPAITAPAGWTVLDRGAALAPAPPIARPRIVRAPASRRLRVRTRSS